jgi:xanthine dehydrogenase accessory factor
VTQLFVVRGAGDLATACGRRLHLCGFGVVHLEVPEPTVIRRTVAFASALDEGSIQVEGVTARRAGDAEGARRVLASGEVAVLVDPDLGALEALSPRGLLDATLLKGLRRAAVPTSKGMAPCVIGLGPGFTAGEDVDFVVETLRGHDLGRVIASGTAAPYTGIPGSVGGEEERRVIRAPSAGLMESLSAIGDLVHRGDILARTGGVPVPATLDGVLRGLLRSGLTVREGQKIGDIDPRGDRRLCLTISDKANAVAGGVLEASFRGLGGWQT